MCAGSATGVWRVDSLLLVEASGKRACVAAGNGRVGKAKECCIVAHRRTGDEDGGGWRPGSSDEIRCERRSGEYCRNGISAGACRTANTQCAGKWKLSVGVGGSLYEACGKVGRGAERG